MPASERLPNRNLNGTRIAVSLCATMVGAGFFCISMLELNWSTAHDRHELTEVTAAFTSAFARERNENNSVPAEFRRMGIEEFSHNVDLQQDRGQLKATMRMPGTPGLEIETVEPVDRINSYIRRLALAEHPEPIVETRFENGGVVGRSIIPSVATSDACVQCHNEELGRDVYEIGSVMGAFVVETDLTSATQKNALYSLVAFAVSLFGGSLLALRERRRMHLVIETLESQVQAEKEKRDAEAFANFLGSHDTLTGLSNRSVFMDHLEKIVEDQRKQHGPDVFVALVDLDDFKAVNDKMGHDAGDALLEHVGRQFAEAVEGCGGVAARIGGDEFAILTHACDQVNRAADLAELLLHALDQNIQHNSFSIQAKCTIGVVALSDLKELTPAALLKAADTALYAAKGSGKGRFRAFDDDLCEIMTKRAKLGAALPKALKNQELSAAFQPKVDLASGQFYGFEALARWVHDGESIPPNEFVRIAEEQNLVRELDLLILRKAAQFAASLEEEFGLPVRIASNFSALNFRVPGLAEDILDVVWHAGLKPERLTIEITETAMMERWDEVREFTNELRQHKMEVALDDFGTGYSSLSYLCRIEFEEIKIDRAFVRDLAIKRQSQQLFTGIVELATRLGKRVVVEGIETASQRKIAMEKRAQIGQGYLFSKPLAAEVARSYFISSCETAQPAKSADGQASSHARRG